MRSGKPSAIGSRNSDSNNLRLMLGGNQSAAPEQNERASRNSQRRFGGWSGACGKYSRSHFFVSEPVCPSQVEHMQLAMPCFELPFVKEIIPE
jgi:hypothetical protein